MSAFNNIVVAYNGFTRQEELPALAVALAQKHGARLHVVNVVPDPPEQGWLAAKGVSATELHEALVERRQQKLEALLAPARERGVATRTAVRAGSPQLEIIREVMDVSADLLVVTDEPLAGKDKRGFATVTRKLLRECPCPVLATRDHRRPSHRRILVAVDVENVSDEGDLNRRALSLSLSLARHTQAELVVFHAWTLWGEQLLRNRSRMSDAEVDEALEATRREREARIDALLAANTEEGDRVVKRLVKGLARKLLPREVADGDVDLVVMGTVCRTGVDGYLIGNTAEKLLNELSCSILTVKPDGFVSPVTPSPEG